MPLTPSYEWSETDAEVVVSVPLRGTKASTADVYAADCFLKVNFAPYLLALDLHGTVDDARCRATARRGVLSVKLSKATPGRWGRLTFDDGGDKAAAKARREAALERKRESDAALAEAMKSRRISDERTTLRQMMGIEEAERQEIEGIKEDEKRRAEDDMYATFDRIEAEKRAQAEAKEEKKKKKAQGKSEGGKRERRVSWSDEQEGGGALASQLGAALAAASAAEAGVEELDVSQFGADVDLVDDIDDDDMMAELLAAGEVEAADAAAGSLPAAPAAPAAAKYEEEEDSEDELAFVPAPRATTGRVEISHTPRVFPTPLRESKRGEEDEWVNKNRFYLKNHPTMGKRLGKDARDISEVDPTWLKGKGDDLYRAGDFESAVNAYHAALQADPEHLPCMSNQAMCLLRLGRLAECIEVCTTLVARAQVAMTKDARFDATIASAIGGENGAPAPRLELAENLDPKSKAILVRTFVRRGAAYSQQGNFSSAAEDLGYARRLRPDDPDLEADLRRLQSLDSVNKVKCGADALFGDGKLAEADAEYAKALAQEPGLISALSNRAALKMALGEIAESVALSTQALDLLMADPAKAAAEGPSANELIGGAAPPPGSQKRKEWVLKTLLRRGAAHLELEDNARALKDYEDALELSPGDVGLQEDVKEIRATLATGEGEAGAAEPAEPVVAAT